MNRIYYIVIALSAALLLGCNSNNKVQEEQAIQGVQYDGQHKGCLKQYDELFCPDKYKPDSLQASGDVIEKFYINERNLFVKVEGNETDDIEVYIKIVPKDK